MSALAQECDCCVLCQEKFDLPSTERRLASNERHLLDLWTEFRAETHHCAQPLYRRIYPYTEKFENVDSPRQAVALCSKEPLKHMACGAPCVLRLAVQPALNNCPICRAPLAPFVALLQREARSHALALAYKQQMLAARDTISAKVLEQMSAIQRRLDRASENDSYWSVRVDRRASLPSRSLSGRVRESPLRDFSVDVRYESVDSNDGRGDVSTGAIADVNRVCWQRRDAERSDSVIVTRQSIDGPWPRLVRDEDVALMLRQVLGLELHRLSSSSRLSGSLRSPPTDTQQSSEVLASARIALQQETLYALREHTESMALNALDTTWRVQADPTMSPERADIAETL
jgi:hypothetical protein